ncbi:Outer membrane protein [Rubellimicrobium thermophilum DSM 16684]|uniref:Outer membrane protein n=1 Tax=Rubellimicrobium thermophilum DSM 16684 TaxID=1123069 RepID=S9SM96_9RHOB|nr:OmpA family protein [Rubellimicrobium thermophilum]EPX87529.1 Outer membrane protein [Rubellimicrobium thermophilum DSM 16684]
MKAFLALLLLGAVPAAAQMPDPPSGATLLLDETLGLAEHALAEAPWSEEGVPLRRLEGEVEQRSWEIPGDDTTLALLAPLRASLIEAGWDVLLDCAAAACGGFDFRMAIEVLPPPAMIVDLADFRYLSAIRGSEGLSLLVSRSGGRGFVQAIHVDANREEAEAPSRSTPSPAPAPTPALAVSDRRTLAARLDAEGHAMLEGLHFAPGSADLDSGGERALAALADWLAEDPARRVAIVGHTDATGPLEANIALSRARARAVADRLVRDYGVASTRLEAHGMGWLAPVASNLTPEGRAANRRVEAVPLP